MNEFCEKLADLLETEQTLTAETYLMDLEEWDSLSVISIAAMADVRYGKKIAAAQIREAKTVAELYNLIVGV